MYRRATSGVRSASTRLSSSLSRIASTETASVSAPFPSSVLNQTNRSKSFSSALRSFRVCSASTRWSHGGSWRSPASLRAQSRNSAPVMEKFERKYATMGTPVSFLCSKMVYLNLYYKTPCLLHTCLDRLRFRLNQLNL